MQTPKVSWLLCSNVVNDQLRLAIDSCLNQSFEDFELIVVANGDRASEVELAVGMWFPSETRLRIFKTEIRHLSFSLSLGLHYARAELIARMDSDDVSYRHRLSLQVEFMESNPDVVVLGTAYEWIDSLGQKLQSVSPSRSDLEIRDQIPHCNPICHPTVMLRRSAVISVGGYLGHIYAEDYHLWTVLAANSQNKFANLPEVCLGYRAVSAGTARKARSAYAAMAASQLFAALMGCGLQYIFGFFISIAKAVCRPFPAKAT
jgi:glycosyltransferase involved in cell wall biosynthesis